MVSGIMKMSEIAIKFIIMISICETPDVVSMKIIATNQRVSSWMMERSSIWYIN